MKSLLTVLEDMSTKKETSDSSSEVDFLEYLDSIRDLIDLIHLKIDEFNEAAGNIPDNDLENDDLAIKEYINSLTEILDSLDETSEEINKRHSSNVLN